MISERDHWLSITDDPDWRRNHINDPNIPLDETLAAITAVFPEQPTHILEIGCGYGRLTTEISHLYPSAHVYGMDINAKILPPSTHKISYLTPDYIFDVPKCNAIYSVAVFQHLPDDEKRDIIHYISTKLRRGGVLRIQFIEGERDNFCDHWTSVDTMKAWFAEAELICVTVDRGLAHRQWTWITGVK